jgi:signal transduction histidine kinase
VRGAAARSAGIKGTGLGLAMVRHIVNAHGGTVDVRSVAGEGSAFTIVLPAKG